MGNRLQTRGWEFDKEELCFKCRLETIQRINISPEEMVSQCTNCGAEAHYMLYCSCEEQKKPDLSRETEIDHEFGMWHFVHEARCQNCGNTSKNEVVMDISRGTVVCGNCLFTREYKFDMFNKCWRR